MTTTENTSPVVFLAGRIRVLNEARHILSDMRQEAAAAAFDAPSGVLAPHPRAQDWGALDEALEQAEHAISRVFIVAEVNCKSGGLFDDLGEDE